MKYFVVFLVFVILAFAEPGNALLARKLQVFLQFLLSQLRRRVVETTDRKYRFAELAKKKLNFILRGTRSNLVRYLIDYFQS